jgi:hypothetical protein
VNKTIEVIVSPTGETKVQTKGFAGSSCQRASRFLEEALGARTREQLTSEFYAQQSAQRLAQENS